LLRGVKAETHMAWQNGGSRQNQRRNQQPVHKVLSIWRKVMQSVGVYSNLNAAENGRNEGSGGGRAVWW